MADEVRRRTGAPNDRLEGFRGVRQATIIAVPAFGRAAVAQKAGGDAPEVLLQMRNDRPPSCPRAARARRQHHGWAVPELLKIDRPTRIREPHRDPPPAGGQPRRRAPRRCASRGRGGGWHNRLVSGLARLLWAWPCRRPEAEARKDWPAGGPFRRAAVGTEKRLGRGGSAHRCGQALTRTQEPCPIARRVS